MGLPDLVGGTNFIQHCIGFNSVGPSLSAQMVRVLLVVPMLFDSGRH